MVIEIFSHAQEGGQIFAAELSSPAAAETNISNKSDEITAKMALTISDNQSQGSHQPVCQDEVTHHQALISGFSYSFKTASFCSERIAFRSGEPVHNSPPPPYLPPKFS